MLIVYLSGFMVHLFVLFLLIMGILCFTHPSAIKDFFDIFASTQQVHFIEQLIRLVVGIALVGFAPMMIYSGFFQAFSWLIIVTSLLLMVLPWQWHQKFAQQVMPYVKNHLQLYGVLSFLVAGMIFYGAWAPEIVFNP